MFNTRKLFLVSRSSSENGNGYVCTGTFLNCPHSQQGLGSLGNSNVPLVEAWNCSCFSDICHSRVRKMGGRNNHSWPTMAKSICFPKKTEPPTLGTYKRCEAGLWSTRGEVLMWPWHLISSFCNHFTGLWRPRLIAFHTELHERSLVLLQIPQKQRLNWEESNAF